MERTLFFTLVAMILSMRTEATSVLASTFGYDPNDATTAFQAAVQAPYDTVVIDLQANDWNVGPCTFFDLADRTIIFQPGVVLQAIPGAFPDSNDRFFRLVRANNVTLIGYGATIRMNKTEYAALNDGEWRHCIDISNSNNITVKGFSLRDSGGDGVAVSGDPWWGAQLYSENIVLEDLQCINNYRQGLSIISVQHMTVRHCLFTATSGTLPEAGLDVEPDQPYHRIVDLNFERCSFTDNNYAGVALALVYLDSISLPVSIRFSDCYIARNGSVNHPYTSKEIGAASDDLSPVGGSVVFERCHVDSSDWSAVVVRKPVTAYGLVFNDCAFTNVSGLVTPYNEPFSAEVSSYFDPCEPFGGLQFNNCLLTYSTPFAWFRGLGWSTSPGIQDVGFTGLIAAPSGQLVALDNCADTINCALAASPMSAVPITLVELLPINVYGEECGPLPIVINAVRNANDVSFPMPISYTLSGDVDHGDDVHLMTGSLMIPSQEISWPDTIVPRSDGLQEPAEYAMIVPLQTDRYTLGSGLPFSLPIYDCLSTALQNSMGQVDIAILPSPFRETFRFSSASDGMRIRVFASDGRLVHTGPAEGEHGRWWMPGVYTVLLDTGAARQTLRLVKTR